MLPSEAGLERAIDGLDAAAFQRLAEAYAEVELPTRFARQQILGRNNRGATTGGWPDSYCLMSDGRVDVLEATRDVRNWTTHLDRDLKKAAKIPRPGIGGFTFVTFGRTPRPGTLTPRREALLRLGVEPSRQTFVFRQDLVRSLRSGRFACVWADILGLSPSAFPFSDLRHASIFGGGSPEQFVPTEEEYESGAVSTPTISRRVDARLKRHGFASVRGRGAAGKTVLAASIGFDRLRERRPVYYIDLADHQERRAETLAQILEVLSVRGDDSVLFIVDNTHQDEAGAAEVFAQWEAVGNGSQLLFIGRQADSPLRSKGLRSPLASIEGTPLELRTDKAALKGVFARLRKRRHPDKSVPVPPARILSAWLETFGGDLIAFSAALARRDPDPEQWELRPSDAREYVEEHYLSGLSEAEHHALCLVADLSALEMSTPGWVVRPAMVSRGLRQGILERHANGIRTVHPGIGELIIAAAGFQIGDFAGLATSDGEIDLATLAITAQRLARLRSSSRAKKVIAGLLTSGHSLLQIFQAMSGSASTRLGTLRDMVGKDALVGQLEADEPALRQLVAESSLDDLTQLMVALHNRLDSALPLLEEAVEAGLEEGWIDLDRLVEDAAAHPSQLPLTLRYLGQFGGKLRPSILPKLAHAGVFRATLFSGGLGAPSRWRDILSAARESPEVATALADAAAGDPERTLAFLVKGEPIKKIEAAKSVPVIREALLGTLRSSWFRQRVQDAPAAGARDLTNVVKLAAAFDPESLSRLEDLADNQDDLDQTVSSWTSSSGSHRHLLSTTKITCPPLHDALKAALRARGEGWTAEAIKDGRSPPRALNS